MRRSILVAVIVGSLAAGRCDNGGIDQNPAVIAVSPGRDSAEEGPRRIWARAEDYAAPSPDGSLVAFVDWNTGDVAVHALASGEDRRLTNKGPWTTNGSWAEEPLFSPDGSAVVYSYGNVLDQAAFQYELRLVTLADTTPRVLFALTPEDEWLVATDWSPTAGILFEVNRGPAMDRVTELRVIDPATGAGRLVARYPAGTEHPHEASFSPDGQFIGYRQGADLRMMNSDGSGDHSLGVEARWLLGWSPDGGGLLIHASAGSRTGIWAVPVRAGARAGEPRLVREGLAAFLPSGLANDEYYYLVPVDAPKVHSVAVDVIGGRELAPPMAITTAMDGAARGQAWSPDGRFLASALLDVRERQTRLILRATDGDEVRELATVRDADVRHLLWSPDGRSLLVFAGSAAGPLLLRVDISSGEEIRTAISGLAGAAMAPDGRLVLSKNATEGDATPGLFLHDPRTGAEQRIADTDGPVQAMGVSPDGTRLAMVIPEDEAGTSRVLIMSLADGTSREIAREQRPSHFEGNLMGSVNWTADGRHLLLMRGSWEGEDNHELVRVPVAGGNAIRVRAAAGERSHTLNPAGDRIAFTGGEARTELWALDDPAFAKP